MCHTAPHVLRALLSHLAQAISDYIVFQVESGAHCIQIFDSWGGQLPPDMWERWSRPYIEQVNINFSGHYKLFLNCALWYCDFLCSFFNLWVNNLLHRALCIVLSPPPLPTLFSFYCIDLLLLDLLSYPKNLKLVFLYLVCHDMQRCEFSSLKFLAYLVCHV